MSELIFQGIQEQVQQIIMDAEKERLRLTHIIGNLNARIEKLTRKNRKLKKKLKSMNPTFSVNGSDFDESKTWSIHFPHVKITKHKPGDEPGETVNFTKLTD